MTAKGLKLGLVSAGALLLCLAAATGAWAQNMFYQELAKDGRIFVFAVGKEYELWAKSGETGKAITRLGYGPNGETVIFDSEAAINLYNFKHDKPGEVFAEAKKPKMEVVWRDGKTRITTDNAYLEISSRIQARFTEELPDDTVQLAGTAAKGDAKPSFRIRRAKMKFEGWFYKKELTYEIQLNWPDVSGSPAGRFLEDANINWDMSKGNKRFMVRFGQFKVPYGRQEINSSGAQQFVDRADVSNRYSRGRETGIALWGALGGNKLEWRVGAFNGNGRTQTANDNDKLQYNARVTWQPTGEVPMGSWASGAIYSEGDFESKDKPIFAIAGNFESNNKANATTNVDLNDRQFSGDAIFKYKGFSALAEYHDRKSKPETGDEFKDKGWFVQAGYLLGSKRQWEVAGRYGRIDPSSLKSKDKLTEIGGVVGYFYNKHNLKLQADFRQLEDEAKGTKNKEIRLQTQLIF